MGEPMQITNINDHDPESVVWRYFDFYKFISLVTTRKLFFPSAEILLDQDEGLLHSKSTLSRKRALASIRGEELTLTEEELQTAKYLKESKTFTFLSSWHLNEVEHYGMWKLYLNGHPGMTINIKIDDLYKALSINKYPAYAGKVSYDSMTLKNFNSVKHKTIKYFFKKSHVYEFENEFRVAVSLLEMKSAASKKVIKEVVEHNGIYVKVDLNELLKNGILLSPSFPAWMKNILIELLKKYSLSHVTVQQSLINEKY